MNVITPDRLRALLLYDQSTGIFSWRGRRNAQIGPGDTAGNLMNRGYIHIMIDGRSYLAHRLAWLYMTGAWPEKFIDHVSGEKADNRFSNLRQATFAENQHNTIKRKTNTSGVKGVSLMRGKWLAYITLNRRRYHLGFFESIHEAKQAVGAARRNLHGEFARAA